MKKLSLACIFLVMNLLQPCPQSVHAQDVESFVRDFYKWYIKESLKLSNEPVFDQAIFKYVCGCTAKRVQFDYNRGVSADDSDYYMKRQDYGEEQLENLMVGASIAVNESLNLVPVSMSNQKEYNPYLVVFVEKTNGRLCISKIESSLRPNFRAPVY
ncbi:hypothetical protein DSECCO2_90730 [anaerobic digester metagenome]